MSPTLQASLRDTIADALRTKGCYVGEIESLATQAIVDAQWAAHLAARTVGTRVKIVMCEERPDGQPARISIHVTPTSPTSPVVRTSWSSMVR